MSGSSLLSCLSGGIGSFLANTRDGKASPAKVATVSCVGLSAAYLFRRWYRWYFVDPFPRVPSRWPIGVIPQFGHEAIEFFQKINEWAYTYGHKEGAYEMDLQYGERVVVVCDWDEIMKLVKMRPYRVTRSSSFQGPRSILDIFLLTEGKEWAAGRRVHAPSFNAQKVVQYCPYLQNNVLDLLGDLDAKMAASKGSKEITVNMSSVLLEYFSLVSLIMLFGRNVDTDKAMGLDLGRESKNLMDVLLTRFVAYTAYWKIPYFGQFLDHGEAAIAKLCGVLEHELQKSNPDNTGSEFVKRHHDPNATRWEKYQQMKEMCGIYTQLCDPTASVVVWALYHLAVDPVLQEAVYDSVKDCAVGKNGEQQELLTPDHVDKLLMVRALWNETLRLRGPAPLDQWCTTEDIEICGRKVVAGTELVVAYRHNLMYNEKLKETLGEDLLEFRPERWIKDNKLVECPPFDSLAYGVGPRKCVGYTFANFTSMLWIARFLQRFRIHPWKGEPMKERSAFTMTTMTDLMLTISHREDA